MRARSRSSIAAIVARPPRLVPRSSSSSGSTPSRTKPPSRTSAGRGVHQGAGDLVGEVEGRVELLRLLAQERGQAVDEGLGRGGQRPQGLAEGHEVPRPRRAQGDPAEDAVEVLHAAERLAQAAAVEGAEGQLLDGVEPVLDALELDEGPQDPLAQQAAAHGGPGVVEDVEERAPPAAVGQALDELEVAPGERVEDEHVLGAPGHEARDVGEVALLGLADVAQRRSGGGRGAREALAAEGLEGGHPEVGQQLAAGPLGLERAVVDGGARDLLPPAAPGPRATAAGRPRAGPGSRGGGWPRSRPAGGRSAPGRPTPRRRTRPWWAPARRRRGCRARARGPSRRTSRAASSAEASSCVPGVMTRTTSRLTTPLAVRGSSTCSHRATRKPWRTRRAM